MRMTLSNLFSQSLPSPGQTYLSGFSSGLTALVSAAMGAALLLTPSTLRAQSAHFGGTQSLSSINFVSYGGILVDGANDLFVADDQNRQIVEYSASSPSTVTDLALGGGEPEYLALDSNNNLYVTTTSPAQVVKLTLTNGVYGQPKIIASSFTAPWGIAVDSTGNVFVADHATGVVYKLVPGSGGGYTQTTFLRSGTLSGPAQVAIDKKNNLYVADRGNNRLVLVSPAGVPTTPFASVGAPTGVAVDSNGNVAVTSSGALIYEQLVSTGGANTYKVTLAATNFTTPYGLAFDASGNMWVDDDHAQQLTRQTPPTAPANFGTVTQGTDSPSVRLAFVFDLSSTLGSPATGVIGTQDFSISYGGTCSSSKVVAAGQTCTVNLVFTPGSVGTESATLALLGNSNAVLAEAGVTGIGQSLPSGGSCAVRPHVGTDVNPDVMCN